MAKSIFIKQTILQDDSSPVRKTFVPKTFTSYFHRPQFNTFRHNENVLDNFIKTKKIIEEGVVECKCGSKRVITSSKQTRAADEPMTVFCHCILCGSKWTT